MASREETVALAVETLQEAVVVNCDWFVGSQQSTTVVVAAPTVMAAQYGYQPVRTCCPHCHADIVTNIDHEVGGLAWMICGIIVVVGLFIAPSVSTCASSRD